jgi:hypothetical protein
MLRTVRPVKLPRLRREHRKAIDAAAGEPSVGRKILSMHPGTQSPSNDAATNPEIPFP